MSVHPAPQQLTDYAVHRRETGDGRTHGRSEYAAPDVDLDQAVHDLPAGCLFAVARDVVSRSGNRHNVADVAHIPDGFRIHTCRGGVLDVVHDQSRINIATYPSTGTPVARWSGCRVEAIERLNGWLSGEV